MCDNLDQYKNLLPETRPQIFHLTCAHRMVNLEHIRTANHYWLGKWSIIYYIQYYFIYCFLICFRCPKSTTMIKCINLRMHRSHFISYKFLIHIIWTILYGPYNLYGQYHASLECYVKLVFLMFYMKYLTLCKTKEKLT